VTWGDVALGLFCFGIVALAVSAGFYFGRGDVALGLFCFGIVALAVSAGFYFGRRSK
jgi:lipopolysaccharide export LptBFGC system permease protein LptF